ncbi:MAG: AAA family ATPase [Gallionella sp.]
MRITRLDLLRYGKFTDKSVSLPYGEKDFHLIVGPNEAGKSTLRNAIQDLLFGIETRSCYSFLHPYSEMRLGALIEDASNKLDFIRTKARSNTLQSVSGGPLSDNALTSFLGKVDRTLFDQMFGLNHERLVNGGEEILSASNDIGQILFQVAAGIEGLGEIRNKLEAEADKLWSKRKSSDREYYRASAELNQAETALKLATVRTKDWQEARSTLDQIGEDLKRAREKYQALEQERIQMERMRRVAPILIQLVELEGELTELGEVVSLPQNAAEQLGTAEQETAIASESLALYEKQLFEWQEKISGLNPDERLIARAADIDALSATRQQLRNHESDIEKREEEVKGLLHAIDEYTRQLGWSEGGEAALVHRLPSNLVRSAIDNLIRRHEALTQALMAATDVRTSREAEINILDAEITGLPVTEIPVTLIDALATARALGDVASQEKRFELQIARRTPELAVMLLELGAWNPGLDQLKERLPPTQDETNALIKKRNDLDFLVASIKERCADVTAEIEALKLEISQYKNAHHPVTLADVQLARMSRDSRWQAIKAGEVNLAEVASEYEGGVVESDSLSDKRHDKAQEETEIQSRIDRLQRLQQQLTDLESRDVQNEQALLNFDNDWAVRASFLGLVGMSLLQVNDWRSGRERVLGAYAVLVEAQSTQAEFVQNVAHVKSALKEVMSSIEPEIPNHNLSTLILRADEVVNTATRAQERRNILVAQKIRAEAAMPDLNSRLLQTQLTMDVWLADLKKYLAIAHLPADANLGAIEGALDLFERMHQNFQKIRELRVNRIDTMSRDLNNFAHAANALAQDVAPEIAMQPAIEIVLTLANSLQQTLAASQDLRRLQAESEQVSGQAKLAAARRAEANAALAPLFRQSNCSDNGRLRIAINHSDRLRALDAGVYQVKKQLLQTGDGLAREALESELAAIDFGIISSRLSEIRSVSDELISQQNRLSGEQSYAQTALNKIAGQDEAARAESQRQEALARMSNAVERYIKVYTAAKLLRWSIEKFRESKQGPMLASASDVFSGLTQGMFERLVVDYECEPLRLSGQRATGEYINIEGMSEGTRDQLYLALRLAALELHLEKTPPLPFIADDLFINYDDGRSKAGFEALKKLSGMTQVIFLTHHEHLIPVAQSVFGERLNLINLLD